MRGSGKVVGGAIDGLIAAAMLRLSQIRFPQRFTFVC
jgi:hypothetical protein